MNAHPADSGAGEPGRPSASPSVPELADAVEALFSQPPFSLETPVRHARLAPLLGALTEYHRRRCLPYARMLTGLGCHAAEPSLSEIPFLPVGLFKRLDLSSVPEEEVRRTLTSSGTTGRPVARIALDGETARLQQRALIAIVSDFIGSRRLPMLIVDAPSVLDPGRGFSARGAAILGFSLFGSRRVFALDEGMRLDQERLASFLNDVKGGPFLIFGFTFIIWQHFRHALQRAQRRFDLSSGVLIHGGGWKKLQEEAVSAEAFAKSLRDLCGLSRIHNYYGMAEQTGSVFMQCEKGHFHCSHFSEVFARRPEDFSLCMPGEGGILQVLSVLPRSYPGHSLLTEDEGVILGADDCPCGRKGTYFTVTGRLKQAEPRGCSDVYAAGFR